MNIFLTGFMGTGKTTIGKRLADELGLAFVDTDQLIEAREGRPIREIFARDGEAYFRAVERKVIEDMPANAVVATGGGAIVDPRNLERMRAGGPIICLTADADTIYARTAQNNDRPLLAGDDPRHRIAELLAARATAYSKADYTVDTSRYGVDAVVAMVRQYLNRSEDRTR